MLKNATILVCLAVLTACSPYKNMQRILRNNPHLLTVSDTVTVHDTTKIITDRVFTDSVFLISEAIHDTVFTVKDNLVIKTIIKDSTIYVSGECKSDTIIKYKKIRVPYRQVKYEEKFNYSWIVLLIVLIALIKHLINEKSIHKSRKTDNDQ